MSRLQGKFALVTGGSAGIGFAIAKRFIEEGARVAITGRNALRLASALQKLGPQCLAIPGDASKLNELDGMCTRLKDAFGGLDIVVANAGVLHAMSLEESDVAKFDEMFAVNVKGVYFTVVKTLPMFNPGASVILVSSVARHIGSARVAAYAATKGAVRAMAKSMAGELAPMGHRVNVICPGPIETEMWQKLLVARPGAANITKQIPMGRIGLPEEIANVALFLASSESSLMTGAELIADGGRVECSSGAEIYRS
jgi:NAD(P)-dependent dehydrogenase (short-subunit alcohol dehydrogenase family)